MTTSQRPWIKAGRRQARARPATATARTVAAKALLSMACTSDSMGGKPPRGIRRSSTIIAASSRAVTGRPRCLSKGSRHSAGAMVDRQAGGIRRGFVHDGPKREPILVGQVVGARQVSQERCERAFAQQLGQRTKPAPDELVAVKHRGEDMDE